MHSAYLSQALWKIFITGAISTCKQLFIAFVKNSDEFGVRTHAYLEMLRQNLHASLVSMSKM